MPVPSRSVAARQLARRRMRSSGYAGRRRSRGDMTATLYPFLVDPPPIPPAHPATEPEAMGLPAFGRAVELLANAAASTGWYARRTNPTTGLIERVPEQPSILTDPYPVTTPWNYKWAAINDLVLYGNHFALYGDLDWRTGRPGWLIPLPADEVWIMTHQAYPGWYAWSYAGIQFDVDELLHVSAGYRSGEVLGLGVLEQYGVWLGGVTAAEDYSRDTFAAGALPPAVLTSRQVQNQDDADVLKAKWRDLVHKREPVVLPDGTNLTPVVGNAEQQQLVEARTWNAQQVANAVGVPGWKLGLDGPSMTYQNIVDADVDWIRDSVDRWARPLTAAITKWLLPSGTEATWDYAGRVSSDQRTTADLLTKYTGAGIYTIDEARAVLEKPPLPAEAPHVDPDPNPEEDVDESDVEDQAAAAGLPNITTPSGATS